VTGTEYFRQLEAALDEAMAVAERAREQGRDPETRVEIPAARDMADRVEKLLGIVGVAERIRELEGEMSREEAALAMVEDFVEGAVGDYDTRAGKIEGAVRSAVALLTEGVVAAPIEGIDRVEVLENDDGSEFVNVYYAGPIRSAGGTAQALSVLVADYARSLLGISEYDPRDEEVERYAEEVGLYDDETGLQYSPSDEKTKFIAEHMPIMLDGEPTGDEEVSGYRDLERAETNNARGGMCLVLAEGIALKAPKIQRYTRDLEAVDWPWLQDLIDGTIGHDDPDDSTDETGDASGSGEQADDDSDPDPGPENEGENEIGIENGPPRAEEHETYLRDLIAGRPVFSHPSEAGGFRLRYGRARNHGFATAGIHPATMHVVGDFLAPGTQIKTERPGKAAGVVPVDTIEGPTVRLANGEVRRIDDPEEARAVSNGIEAIVDLGEYLVNYGEFVENNHPLSPASYTVEWWRKEFEHAGADVRAMEDDPAIDLSSPSVGEAIAWATGFDAPLHPAHTYLWHDISVEEFRFLAGAVGDGWIDDDVLVIPDDELTRDLLERLLVEHHQGEVIEVDTWRPLGMSLGLDERLDRTWDSLPAGARTHDGGDNAVEAVNAVAPFRIRERAPTRVGNRMGRPEKSEKRELSPTVHAIFPIGEAGGAQRDVGAATNYAADRAGPQGRVTVDVGRRECDRCGEVTYRNECPDCGENTTPQYACPDCGRDLDPDDPVRAECPRCEVEATAVESREIDVAERYREALDTVGERENAFEILKGVKGLTSTVKTPEPLEKGVLRAKHGVSAFKDGTVRYDMTDLPVTAVRPAELDMGAEDMRELGYETDLYGDPLRHDEQLVELKVQDVVLSDGAADHLLSTADFVDELLEEFYGLDPFYELDDRRDLLGELVFGMAPHTSAAVVARVVGFTSAAAGYAHPYFHASKRRNCFHPDAEVRYESGTGAVRSERVEEFVETRLAEPREDDAGALIEDLDGDTRVLTVDDGGKRAVRPVEAVSKHPAPDHLVRVETRSGRTLRATANHSMVRWDEEGPRHVPAHELEAGDVVPRFPGDDAPTPVPDPVERVEFVSADVEHTYCLTVSETHRVVANGLVTGQCDGDEDCVMLLMDGLLNFSREYLPDKRGGSVAEDSRLVAVGPDGDVRFLTFEEFWNELDSLIEVDGKYRKRTCYEEGWRTYAFDENNEVSLKPIEKAIRYRADDEQLLRIETSFGRTIEVTEHHSLFRYRDGIEEVAGEDVETGDLVVAPRKLGVETDESVVADGFVDEEFAWLLGLFVGGGTTGGVELWIDGANEDVVDRATEIAAAKFGREPDRREMGRGYQLRFPVVSREIFRSLGFEGEEAYDPGEKVVPDSILEGPRDVVLAFLRGFVAGDAGEEHGDTPTVAFNTTSEDVKDGIVFLLHRLGHVASITERPGRGENRYTVTASHGTSDDAPDPLDATGQKPDRLRSLGDGDLSFIRVESVERVDYEGHLYDLQVGGDPVFVADWLYAHNSMDAPLVMSSRIHPAEIDDEAHNLDVVEEYPLELYEATREMAHPDQIDVETGVDRLGTDRSMAGFSHTHDTSDLARGPDLSAYKTLGDMEDKMDAQLELARKLRAVDETDVAERIIEYHFLPDLIGNLRAFSRQEVRCLDCGEKYRRFPLSGDCRNCGGDVGLTVHEGSVTKYLETATRIAEEYGTRKYTKQRLEVLERSIDSIFENDMNKPTSLGEFM